MGSALAVALRRAGHRVTDIVVRDLPESRVRGSQLAKKVGAKVSTLGETRSDADIIWVCVTDDAIAPAAAELAKTKIPWRGKVVLHSSAALTSDLLRPLKRKGAAVASVHPMMTFVRGGAPKLEGVSFALEGDAAAIRKASVIVKELGGDPFPLRKDAKVLYHAMGSFSSPLVVVTLSMAEQVGKKAGLPAERVRKVIRPILEKTIANFLAQGAAGAFSGPLNRGNVKTIERHMKELRRAPEAKAVYQALAAVALKNLPVKNKKELQKALGK